jgi:nitroreductase/NAD-dependent dihydropyrimidine dehydrogenase PreA subunit
MEEILKFGDSCNSCGLCSKVCPAGVIVDVGNGKPGLTKRSCIFCGHCVAICGQNAIFHNKMDNVNFKKVDFKLISNEISENFLSSKRSVRFFQDRIVEKEKIESLISVANKAPTGRNMQNRKYVVIQNKNLINTIEKEVCEGLKKFQPFLNIASGKYLGWIIPNQKTRRFLKGFSRSIDHMNAELKKGNHPVFHDAPCLILTYGINDGVAGDRFSKDNAITAQTYLMLHAHGMGLGSTIIGYALLVPKVLRKHISIPKNFKFYGCTTIGYPAVKFKKTVDRKPAQITWL